jgi:hypothetical protein
MFKNGETNDPNLHLEKKGKGRRQKKTPTWWPMEGSKLSGHWKVPSLVAIGMFHVWWPMEGSNAWWPLEGEIKTSFSPLFIFTPNKFFLYFFSLI